MSQAILTIRRIRDRRWFKLLILLITPLLCLISCYQLSKGCLYWTCVPERGFSVPELGIPERYFPEGAIINKMQYTRESDGSLESGNMTVYWQRDKGLTVYNAWRFASPWKANLFYASLNRNNAEYGMCPEQLMYENNFSDRYVIRCGWSKFGGYRAVLVAQYEEFVISVNSVLDEEMSFQDFSNIISYIDEDFGERLNP